MTNVDRLKHYEIDQKAHDENKAGGLMSKLVKHTALSAGLPI